MTDTRYHDRVGMSIEAAIAGLPVRSHGGSWYIFCPAPNHPGGHTDKNCELKYGDKVRSDGSRIVLAKCHSHDCAWEDILGGLGMYKAPSVGGSGQRGAPAKERISGGDIERLRSLLPACAACGQQCVREAVNGYPILGCGCGLPYQSHWANLLRGAEAAGARLEFGTEYVLADGRPRARVRIEPGKRIIWDSEGKGRKTSGASALLWVTESNAGAARLVIVEGEKAAAAVVSATDAAIPVTYSGAASSAHSANYQGVIDDGRQIVVWPDKDEVGLGAAKDIHRALARGGLPLRSAPLLVRVDGFGDKSDAADIGWQDIVKALDEASAWTEGVKEFERTVRLARIEADKKFGIELDAMEDRGCIVGIGWDYLRHGHDMERVLSAYGSRLVVAHDPYDSVSPDDLYMVRDNGLLTDGEGFLSALFRAVGEEYAAQALHARLEGKELGAVMANAGKFTDARLYKNNLQPVLSGTVVTMRGRGDIGLVVLGKRDTRKGQNHAFDKPGQYIGSEGGVIDLGLDIGSTPRVLDADEGREQLITRSSGAHYRPDDKAGRERVIELFFGHFQDWSIVEFILDSAAFAMRGRPSRRAIGLVGEPNSGKSTSIEALAACVGQYGGGMRTDALLRSRNHQAGAATSHTIKTQWARILTISDMTESIRINSSLFKEISGGDVMSGRDLFERERDWKSVSTMFFAWNPDSAPSFDKAADGVRDRLVTVPYPTLPESKRRADFRSEYMDQWVRDALFTELCIRAARIGFRKDPPAIPESIREATEYHWTGQFPDDAVAFARVALSNAKKGRVQFASVYEAAKRFAGTPEGRMPWYLNDREFSALLRQIHGLSDTEPVRVAGTLRRGWKDWVLLTDAEIRAALDDGSFDDDGGAADGAQQPHTPTEAPSDGDTSRPAPITPEEPPWTDEELEAIGQLESDEREAAELAVEAPTWDELNEDASLAAQYPSDEATPEQNLRCADCGRWFARLMYSDDNQYKCANCAGGGQE